MFRCSSIYMDFSCFLLEFLPFHSWEKTQKTCVGCKRNSKNGENLFFQKRSHVGWNYQRNQRNENRIIFDHGRVIFRSILGGPKSPISNIKTPFVKKAKTPYFGSEIFSKSDQKNRFFRKNHKCARFAIQVAKSHIGWFLTDLEHLFDHFLKQSKWPISLFSRVKMSYFSRF